MGGVLARGQGGGRRRKRVYGEESGEEETERERRERTRRWKEEAKRKGREEEERKRRRRGGEEEEQHAPDGKLSYRPTPLLRDARYRPTPPNAVQECSIPVQTVSETLSIAIDVGFHRVKGYLGLRSQQPNRQ